MFNPARIVPQVGPPALLSASGYQAVGGATTPRLVNCGYGGKASTFAGVGQWLEAVPLAVGWPYINSSSSMVGTQADKTMVAHIQK